MGIDPSSGWVSRASRFLAWEWPENSAGAAVTRFSRLGVAGELRQRGGDLAVGGEHALRVGLDGGHVRVDFPLIQLVDHVDHVALELHQLRVRLVDPGGHLGHECNASARRSPSKDVTQV
eukprot:652901-Prorocentrum_minimum.AAC.4